MARMIYFKDGTSEAFLSDIENTEDSLAAFKRMLQDRLGNDVSELLSDIIGEINDNKEYDEECRLCMNETLDELTDMESAIREIRRKIKEII